MNAITTHLDDLLTVLRASASLRPAADTATHLRAQVARRLDPINPGLAARSRCLDDWHAEVLADFMADAHVVATALDPPLAGPPAADETRVG